MEKEREKRIKNFFKKEEQETVSQSLSYIRYGIWHM